MERADRAGASRLIAISPCLRHHCAQLRARRIRCASARRKEKMQTRLKQLLCAGTAVCGLLSGAAYAGYAPTYSAVGTGASSATKTRAYVGLRWSLYHGATPSLVLGAMRTHVDSGGKTEGSDLSMQFNVFGGFRPGPLRLGYLRGKNSDQGEYGVGYDFASGLPQLSVGLNAAYLNADAVVDLHGHLDDELMLDSAGHLDRPGQQTTCALDVGAITGHYLNSSCTGSVYTGPTYLP
jgi:hypothetical protein